jgi:Rrf2 family iron-sulfur cluster assembly transcriptional regulator
MGKEMAVSPKYLRKLLGPLERSGIVKSVQGIYGGFLLNKEPREITIQMIADAYGEKLNLTDCLRGKSCPLLATCLTRPVWERLLRSITQQFVGTTIQDILDGSVAKE